MAQIIKGKIYAESLTVAGKHATINGKNIITTVNNKTADTEGNVNIGLEDLPNIIDTFFPAGKKADIKDGTDLNSIIKDGFYSVAGDKSKITNFPVDSTIAKFSANGVLVVSDIKDGGVLQLYVDKTGASASRIIGSEWVLHETAKQLESYLSNTYYDKKHIDTIGKKIDDLSTKTILKTNISHDYKENKNDTVLSTQGSKNLFDVALTFGGELDKNSIINDYHGEGFWGTWWRMRLGENASVDNGLPETGKAGTLVIYAGANNTTQIYYPHIGNYIWKRSSQYPYPDAGWYKWEKIGGVDAIEDLAGQLKNKVDKTQISHDYKENKTDKVASTKATAELYQNTVKLGGSLGDSTNLNDLKFKTNDSNTQPNIYHQRSNINATTENNYPVNKAGTLFVLPSAYNGQQLYMPFGINVLYKRDTKWQNEDETKLIWSDWSKVGTNEKVDYASCPIGVPIPYPSKDIPEGYLLCNGQTFDKTKYPLLAEVYPTGKLPDLRGEFIRGWDNARGVDKDRNILTTQTENVGKHTHTITLKGASGQWDPGLKTAAWGGDDKTHGPWTATTDESGSGETRPRNIAFNYIVRAVNIAGQATITNITNRLDLNDSNTSLSAKAGKNLQDNKLNKNLALINSEYTNTFTSDEDVVNSVFRNKNNQDKIAIYRANGKSQTSYLHTNGTSLLCRNGDTWFNISVPFNSGQPILTAGNMGSSLYKTQLLTQERISQTTGNDTNVVMSQKASTDELNKKVNLDGGDLTGTLKFNHKNNTIYDSEHMSYAPSGSKNYLRKMRSGPADSVWHETVQSGTYTISTGITDANEIFSLKDIGPESGAYVRGKKVVTADRIVKTVGDSETNVMSQKAVTDALGSKVSAADLTQTITADKLKAPSNLAVNTALKEQDPRQWGFGAAVNYFTDSINELDVSVVGFADSYVEGVSPEIRHALSIINIPAGKIGITQIGMRANSDTPRTFRRSKVNNSEWGKWVELYDTGNTSIDPNGFLRASGSKITLTTSNLVQTTGVATQNVMSQKIVTDELDKKVNLDGSNIMTGRLVNNTRGEAIRLSNESNSHIGFYNEENGTKRTGWIGKPAKNEEMISIAYDGGARLDVRPSSININSTLFVTKNKDAHREIIIKEEGSNAILSVKLAATPSLVVRKPDNETYYNITIPYTSGAMAIEGSTPSFVDVKITSDQRAKTDITPISNALEKIQGLNGSMFTYKETNERSGGIIAQDLLKVLPDGVDQTDPEQLKVHYNAVIGLLVEAVKEQQKSIDHLYDIVYNKNIK